MLERDRLLLVRQPALDLPPDEGSVLVNDVRMRGFASRTTVPQAWQWLQQFRTVEEVEVVSLTSAWGRVLGQAIESPLDVPAFDRSAMDGYAVRAEETLGASDYNPLPFQIVGESLPGRPAERAVVPGTCIRIMTGAPIPAGATAVVPAEQTRLPMAWRDAAGGDGEVIEVTGPVPEAKHIGRRGEDIRQGTLVLPRHRRLRPQDVAILASLGMPEVPVLRRPIVRIVVTGSELVAPGSPRQPFQIYDANSFLLHGLVARDGGVVEQPPHCLSDERAALEEALLKPGADLILVSGGSSVGAEDLAPELVRRHGSLDIHGLAMRPSSPAGMGLIEGIPVFLLPGNPVSCLCAYDFFAGRTLRQLGGLNPAWPYAAVKLPLVRKVSSPVGRVDYCRVRCVAGGVEPIATSGASILSSTTRADGFIVIPAESEGYPAGSVVEVYLYDSLMLSGTDPPRPQTP